MIPDNSLSLTLQYAPYLQPDDVDPPALTDYEIGGVGIADPSQGLRVQTWTLRCINGDMVAESPTTSPVVVFSPGVGVTWVSLSFDQNMQPFVAFYQSGTAKIYYYDTVSEDYTTLSLPAGTSTPCVAMDDKRDFATSEGINDVILVYERSGNLYFRQQRDRFLIEYLLKTGVTGRVTRVGMHKSNRLQIKMLE